MTRTGWLPALKVSSGPKLDALRPKPLPTKAGRNGWPLEAVRPLTVTVIGAYVAQAGTVTVKEVALAATTAAWTAPK
jgi:hypothetical protein